MKILVVDDEDKIRNIVRMYFIKEGFTVAEAANGKYALEILDKEQFDIIILDIMMPGIDGWTVCREVRTRSTVPIIMLTAREEELDRVLGLELGADDYLVKPFSPRELLARVNAILRRTAWAGEKDEKRAGDLDALFFSQFMVISPKARSVIINGQAVSLRVKEFDLLLFIARYPSRVFTREELLEGVWGYDYNGDTRTVDTHVNRLRDRLGKVTDCPEIIHTVWGVGYKFEVVE